MAVKITPDGIKSVPDTFEIQSRKISGGATIDTSPKRDATAKTGYSQEKGGFVTETGQFYPTKNPDFVPGQTDRKITFNPDQSVTIAGADGTPVTLTKEEYKTYSGGAGSLTNAVQQAQALPNRQGLEMQARQDFSETEINPLLAQIEDLAKNNPSLLAETDITDYLGTIGKGLDKIGGGSVGNLPVNNILFKALGIDEETKNKIKGSQAVAGLLAAGGVAASTFAPSIAAGAAMLKGNVLIGGLISSLTTGALIVGGGKVTALGQDKINTGSKVVQEIDSRQDQLRGNLDAGTPPQDIVASVRKDELDLERWEAYIKEKSIINADFLLSRDYEALQSEIETARRNMAETLRAVQNVLATGQKDVDYEKMTYFTEELNQSNKRLEALK